MKKGFLKKIFLIIMMSFCFLNLSIIKVHYAYWENSHSNSTSGSERFDNRNTDKGTQGIVEKYNELNKWTLGQIMPNDKGEYSQDDIKKLQEYCWASIDWKSWDKTIQACNEKFASSWWWDTGPMTVTITEAIPWLSWSEECSWPPESRKCNVIIKPWFESVIEMLSWLIKYATFIVLLAWIFMLVLSGIRMSIEWKKEDAIKHFKQVLLWLVVLFLIGFILNTVAPWIYK